MAKESKGQKKFQLDQFVGSQSFIFRTDDKKEFLAYTGLKKLDAESMKKFLYDLNDIGDLIKAETPMSPSAPQVNYLEKISNRLKLMGAKTKAQELKMLNKLAGFKLKKFPAPGDLQPVTEQKIYATLLQGGVSDGKK